MAVILMLDALRRNSRGMIDYKNVGSLTDNGCNSRTQVPNISTDQQILWHFVKLVKFVVKTNVGVDFNDFWARMFTLFRRSNEFG